MIKRQTAATCTPGDLSGTRQVGVNKRTRTPTDRAQKMGHSGGCTTSKVLFSFEQKPKTFGRVTQEQGDVPAPTRSKQWYGDDGLSPFRLAPASSKRLRS